MKIKIILLCTTLLYVPVAKTNSALTISESGLHTLGSPIAFAASASGDSIITINASDVVLDLAGYAISQSNATAGVHGIVVGTNSKRIVIENGIINSVTGTGIVINEGSATITIKNMLFDSCGVEGIACAGSAVNQISDVDIIDCIFNNCCSDTVLSDFCIALQQVTQFNITNCLLSANGNSSRPFSGIRLDHCLAGHCNNVNVTASSAGTSCNGFRLSNSNGCIFNNCIVNNHNFTTIDLKGFVCDSLSTCTDNIFSNCHVMKNIISTSGDFVGFDVSSTSTAANSTNDNNVFLSCQSFGNIINDSLISFESTNAALATYESCLASTNTSVNGSCIGFNTTGTGIDHHFTNCRAQNQYVTSGGTCIGFNIDSVTVSLIYQCVAFDNLSTSSLDSFGFVLTGTTTANTFLKNISSSNGAVVGNQFLGFDTNQHTQLAINNTNGTTLPWTNLDLI